MFHWCGGLFFFFEFYNNFYNSYITFFLLQLLGHLYCSGCHIVQSHQRLGFSCAHKYRTVNNRPSQGRRTQRESTNHAPSLCFCPAAAPTIYGYKQCMEIDSQYFWSGAPWDMVARKYVADTLNAGLKVDTFKQTGVIAVSAMEAIGLSSKWAALVYIGYY